MDESDEGTIDTMNQPERITTKYKKFESSECSMTAKIEVEKSNPTTEAILAAKMRSKEISFK